VFDESHRLRNKNNTTLACLAISWQADIKFILTGTPIINVETDLFYQCLILGRENEFGGLSGLKSACENPALLQEICKKFTLRREKKDVLPANFPDKYDRSIIIQPDLRKYYAFEDSLRSEIAALFRQKMYSEAYRLIFTRIGALKQAVGIAKVPEVVQFISDIEKTGDKALVFGCYNVTLSTIANFSGYPLINGCTPRKKRREIVHNFEKKGNGLVLSGAVGGEGLTLTRANHVVFAELFWYPALHEQAEDRAHRISQRKTVYSHYLVTKATIEEKIWSILMRKYRKTEAFCKSIKAEIVKAFIEESDVLFD
jgi:SNF2 family DNA or RNA helicase